jgi:hypothetical protein
MWPFLLTFFARFGAPFFEGIRIYTVLCALYYDLASGKDTEEIDGFIFYYRDLVDRLHARLKDE